MENISLRQRSLENVRIFWEKSQDHELKTVFPFEKSTLEDANKLYEESLEPDAKSFGRVIYIDDKYIGDVWCYAIDEVDGKEAFLSIVIFDKEYWGRGIGIYVIKRFCRLVFEKYTINKICTFTYKSNERSIRALESAGFSKIEEFMENGMLSCYYELQKQYCSGHS